MIGTSLVYLAVRINPLNLLVQYSNLLLYSVVIVNRFAITMEYLSGPVFAHNLHNYSTQLWDLAEARFRLKSPIAAIAQ